MKKQTPLANFLMRHDQYDNSPILISNTERQIDLPEYKPVDRFKYLMEINDPFAVSEQFKQQNGIQKQHSTENKLNIQKQKGDRPKKSMTKKQTPTNTPNTTKLINHTTPKLYYLVQTKMLKPTLVLDLDSTILYSRTKPIPLQDLCETPPEKQFPDTLFTCYRSYLYPFMQFLHQYFEVVVWSAGEYNYVRHRLLHYNLIQFIDSVLSRDHCTIVGETFIKDLNKLGRNQQNIILLDDNFSSCVINVQNCIPVDRFIGQHDEELLQLIILLRKILQYETMIKGIECQIGCLKQRIIQSQKVE